MILSNKKIHEALDRGWLKITPEPPRHVEKGPYQTTAVDLRLGGEISRLRSELPVVMDLRSGKFPRLYSTNAETFTLNDSQPFELKPQTFVLGKTMETVELPLPANAEDPCLAARVEGRSSYARCGLLIHFTAPTIHAGFKGTITLELINLGPYPILLGIGMPICQLIIEKVDGLPSQNDSQFQGQTRPGGSST